jgi:hypothetical protein
MAAAWLDTLRPEQQKTAVALTGATLAAAPEMLRAIKWGNLVFLHKGQHAVALVMHKDHANLQVFNGAGLAADFPSLEGSGKGMRHLKFRYAHDVDERLVGAVVKACVSQLERDSYKS